MREGREAFEAARSTVLNLATTRHAHLVEGAVKWALPRRILEVGVFHGYMTGTLARALYEAYGDQSERLVALDSWHDYRTSEEILDCNLKIMGVRPIVKIVTGNSKTVDPSLIGHVDMAVIDANHTLEWCQADTDLAISLGAHVLFFHDADQCEGVRLVVESLRSSGRWGVVELPFDAGFAMAVEIFAKDPAPLNYLQT